MPKNYTISRKLVYNDLVSLGESFSNNSSIISFVVVGSYNYCKTSKFNDVDCLVITKKHISDKHARNMLFTNNKSDYLGKSDDSFRYNVRGIEYGLVIITKNSFAERVNSIINAKNDSLIIKPVSWAIGGMIPEVLLRDIVNAKIFHDKDNYFNTVQAGIVEKYPIILQNRLIDILKKDIINKYRLLASSYTNTPVFNIGLSELYIPLARYFYAHNAKYIPSIKHIKDEYRRDLVGTDKKNFIQLQKIYGNISKKQKYQIINYIIKDIEHEKK